MFKVTLVVALFAFANTVFASGKLKLHIQPLSQERAVIAISSPIISKMKILVIDNEDRIVLYKETAAIANSGENYLRVYDFSDMEDGQYKITVVCNDLTTERQFQKEEGKIKVCDEKTTILLTALEYPEKKSK